jgi:uncharacterized protein (DUF433 family)
MSNVKGHSPRGTRTDRKRKAEASRNDTKREKLLSRISIDPNICSGKPCIRGHRIWVSLILDFLAGGMTKDELLQEYPQLEPADIEACITYGAEKNRRQVITKDD